MFAMIETLLTIALWGVAILLFVGGIFISVSNLKSGNGWKIFGAMISIGLGIAAFCWTYNWSSGSIVWCMLFSGLVTVLLQCGGEKTGTNISPTSDDYEQRTDGTVPKHKYNGSCTSYGDHTLYTGGNASNRYGDAEYFNNGDVGVTYGEVTYYNSGGHSVKSGDVTYFYDKNGRETGKCIQNGNQRSYYGDCGPCTSKND